MSDRPDLMFIRRVGRGWIVLLVRDLLRKLLRRL